MSFQVDAHKLKDFSLEDESFPMQDAELFNATATEDGKEYLIKKVPKSKADAIENEKEAYLKFGHHENLAAIYSVFTEGDHIYVVYKRPSGECMGKWIEEGHSLDQEQEPIIVRQYANLMTKLHSKKIKLLNTEVSNVWYHEDGKLTVVGLQTALCKDAKKDACPSYLAKFEDGKAKKCTDWIGLGIFAYKAYSRQDVFSEGNEADQYKNGKQNYSCYPELKEFLDLCFAPKDARKKWEPLKEDFLKPSFEVVTTETSIQVGRFCIDWSEGIKFSIGDTGIKISGDGLALESGDGVFSVGLDGISIAEADWPYGTIGIGPEGLKFENRWTTVTLGPEGYKQEGWGAHVNIGAEGFKWESSRGSLCIPTEGDFQLNIDSAKPSFQGKNFCIIVADVIELKVGADGFDLKIADAHLAISPKEGFVFDVENDAKIQITTEGQIKLSTGRWDPPACLLVIDKTGLNGNIGDTELTVNGDGFQAAAEGFVLKIDKNGAKIDNNNAPIDLSSMPKVKLDLSMPSIPGIPPIPPPPMPSIDTPDPSDLLGGCCNVV